jgi:hypothetical protein
LVVDRLSWDCSDSSEDVCERRIVVVAVVGVWRVTGQIATLQSGVRGLGGKGNVMGLDVVMWRSQERLYVIVEYCKETGSVDAVRPVFH